MNEWWILEGRYSYKNVDCMCRYGDIIVILEDRFVVEIIENMVEGEFLE